MPNLKVIVYSVFGNIIALARYNGEVRYFNYGKDKTAVEATNDVLAQLA